MAYVVPLTYTVRRPFTAGGTAYAVDHVMEPAELVGLNLSVLVSSGRLVAIPDTSQRKGVREHGFPPTYVHPKAYEAAITP